MHILLTPRRPMFQILITLFLFMTCTMQLQAQEKENTIRIASYNVQWFMDEYPDPYSIALRNVHPKSKDKIQQIMQVIRELNADVVTFQEIENHGILNEVVRDYLPDMGYKYIVVGQTNSGVGQQIGVISRKPIVSTTSYRYSELKLPDDPRTWLFARDLLKVTIQVTPEKTMDVYTVHFKSKRDSINDKNSNAWRLAESMKTREIIADRLAKEPDAWVVLAGDFNDTPDSPVLRAFIGGEKPFLSDPHSGLPEEKRISYLRAPYRSIIDFTLLSPVLASRVVHAKTSVFAYETATPSNIGGSDHSPVVVTLKLD